MGVARRQGPGGGAGGRTALAAGGSWQLAQQAQPVVHAAHHRRLKHLAGGRGCTRRRRGYARMCVAKPEGASGGSWRHRSPAAAEGTARSPPPDPPPTCPSPGKLGGRPPVRRWRCSVRPTRLLAGSTHRMRARSRWLGLHGGGAAHVRGERREHAEQGRCWQHSGLGGAGARLSLQQPARTACTSDLPQAMQSPSTKQSINQPTNQPTPAPELLAPVCCQVGAKVEGVHGAAAQGAAGRGGAAAHVRAGTRRVPRCAASQPEETPRSLQAGESLPACPPP